MKGNAILDIISHCSSTEIGKFRLLNKACNKSTYQFFFISRHLRGTNSVFGYLIQSYERFKYRSSFVSCIEEKDAPGNNGISLEFLPSRDVKIKAWDTHHGILLCVDNAKFKGGRRIPDYIICKPAMKQYRIIPNPKTRYFTIATGLVVIQSNPFWYKIVRVS
ncbi:LOW QUALITY PROTEIN: F-box protein At5g41720 [Eutrema salsugineum]|uniref:LOW QUALITY PROTEIN: F-box protein At5g41720 n=1 Tax=Eutrema salsugineum TaxID=72664 RepID=UPI000CED2133|nr:LOW QUALITY PROTEIN: F-box protein At5g41720 [Eutrema salsugineum]